MSFRSSTSMSSGSAKMSIESKPISFVFRMPKAVSRPAWAQAELIKPSFMGARVPSAGTGFARSNPRCVMLVIDDESHLTTMLPGAASTASQRAMVLRLSRPEMSGSVAGFQGAEQAGHRAGEGVGEPGFGPAGAVPGALVADRGVVDRARDAFGPAGPADRAEGEALGPLEPPADADVGRRPLARGPFQTSSQDEARAPLAYSRMYRLIPSSWANVVRGSGRVLARTRTRVAEPVAEGVEVVDAHDERRERPAAARPRASSAGWRASRSSPAPARRASPRSSSDFSARTDWSYRMFWLTWSTTPAASHASTSRAGLGVRHRQRLLRQDAPDPPRGGSRIRRITSGCSAAGRRRRRPRPRGRRASASTESNTRGTPRSAATSSAVARVREVSPTTRKPAFGVGDEVAVADDEPGADDADARRRGGRARSGRWPRSSRSSVLHGHALGPVRVGRGARRRRFVHGYRSGRRASPGLRTSGRTRPRRCRASTDRAARAERRAAGPGRPSAGRPSARGASQTGATTRASDGQGRQAEQDDVRLARLVRGPGQRARAAPRPGAGGAGRPPRAAVDAEGAGLALQSLEERLVTAVVVQAQNGPASRDREPGRRPAEVAGPDRPGRSRAPKPSARLAA